MAGAHPLRRPRARDRGGLPAAAQPAAGHRALRARQSRRDGAVDRRRDRARGRRAAVGGHPLRQRARLSTASPDAAARLPRAAGRALGDLSRAHRGAARAAAATRATWSAARSIELGDRRARAAARAPRPRARSSAAASLVVGARTIYVLAQRRAFPVATYLAYGAGAARASRAAARHRSAACCASRSALIGRERPADRGELPQLHAPRWSRPPPACHKRGVPVIALHRHAGVSRWRAAAKVTLRRRRQPRAAVPLAGRRRCAPRRRW